jgi:hypothetical protein
MKITIKKLFQITMLLSFILLSSCERELYDDVIKSNQSNIQLTDVSLSNLNTNVSKKINQKISDLKNEGIKNEAAKFQYNSSLGIYIDTENGKLIQADGKSYYTFPMFRESEEKLENIIFIPKNDGDLDAYLAKYNIKPEEYASSINNENLSAAFEKFGAGPLCVDLVSTTVVYPYCEYTDGIHPHGERCLPQTIVDVITICSNDGAGGVDTGSMGGSNGTPGGNHQSGIGGGTNDLIITMPIGLTQDQIKTKDFILGLSPEQSDWYFAQQLQTTNSIIAYLIQNNFSSESVSFVHQMVDLCISNNSSFNFDNSVNASNAQVFNTITEFNNYINSNIVNQLSSDFSIINYTDIDKKTSYVTFRFPVFLDLIERFDQNRQSASQPWSITSNTFELSGVTLGSSWTQSPVDNPIIKIGDVATITFRGYLHLNAFIGGYGNFYTQEYKIKIKINMTTGVIFAAEAIK